jgi:hypothetical protein
VSVETILEKWEYNKNYSCHKGSGIPIFMLRISLERRFAPLDRKAFVDFIAPNNQIYHVNTVEKYYQEMALLIRNFQNFYNWWKEDYILVKSEFVVGDKRSKVCGTIDNLSFNKKTNEFAIFELQNKQKDQS